MIESMLISIMEQFSVSQKKQDCIDFQEKANKERILRRQQKHALDGWLDYAGFYPTSEVVMFTGTYSVPPNPVTDGSQVLFYFIGTENLGQTDLSILQPVLTWGNGYNGWNMASWNCCPQGQTIESNSIDGIKAGSSVSGIIDFTSPDNWTVTSNYNNKKVVLTVPSAQRDFNWCDVTLETYTVTACGNFPKGPCVFSDMTLTDTYGSVTPSWQADTGPTECGGKLTINSPSEITISHN